MLFYFSRTTNGFYTEHQPRELMPTDLVEVTEEQHQEIFRQQSLGKIITSDENGNPITVDRPASTTEELAVEVRTLRNSLLTSSDWTQLGDVPQSVKDSWAVYRQELRDVPQQVGFPHNVVWPEAPQ